MKLEDLANELLIDIFEYIDFIDLLRTFYDLNSRLNKLIFNYYRNYHLNFRSIRKYEFHLICQRYLPSISNQIISLYLSNDDQTPNLFELFHSYNFNFNQFHHLQLLSFEYIYSLRIINQILPQCPYLKQLYMLKCYFQDQEEFCYLIENIWNLPKLEYCQIVHQNSYGLKFTNQTMISYSIQNLSFENFHFDFYDLSNLLHCTPLLEYLNISIQSHINPSSISTISSSINSIKLSCRKSFNSMIKIFEIIPNITHLTLQINDIYLNGYEWKKILENYFLKLKIFQFKMNFKLSYSRNLENELENLLDSFRTSFWIKQHQWFIQCDGLILSNTNYICILYTLPYAFDEYLLTNRFWSKSTNDFVENQYDNVKILTIMNIRNSSYWYGENFRNISHLKIYLPLNDIIWSFIQSLNKLISLEIILIQEYSLQSVQNLLDKSIFLTSLCLGNFINLQIIAQLKSPSIYRLDFIKKNKYKKFLDSKQCEILINSSLGKQCTILLIYLENRMNILQLMKNLPKLQSFIFQCKDNDNLLQWLNHHLPSTCSITRDQQLNFRLWIK